MISTTAEGSESLALVVFKRDEAQVRLFWASEMHLEMADPGQDPRDAPDIASLWSVLDLTPEGVKHCVDTAGIGFCFAPVYHPGMRYAIGPRRGRPRPSSSPTAAWS